MKAFPNFFFLAALTVSLSLRLLAEDDDKELFPQPSEIYGQIAPVSWPTDWDVQMDPEILTDREFRLKSSESLETRSSLLLTVADEDLFGPAGLLREELSEGSEEHEAPVKVTYFKGNQTLFSVKCGLRLQGSGSVSFSKKRNFRLKFSKEFGENHLSFDLFNSGKKERFENLLIRSPTHDSWAVIWPGWRTNPRYVNDLWALESARSLGQPVPRQKWVHLYINRIYWGAYLLSERPDEHFAAASSGGGPEDYDVFNADKLREGSWKSRRAFEHFLETDLQDSPRSFKKLETLINLNALIDHLILQIYQGKTDWPDRNYTLIGRRSEFPRFIVTPWDSEIGFYQQTKQIGWTKQNALNFAPLSSPQFLSDHSGPGSWLQKLRRSREFQQRFEDRFDLLTRAAGVLSPAEASERYRQLLDEATPFLFPESLRWGDSCRNEPYRPQGEEWDSLTGAQSWLFSSFFPLRGALLKEHFIKEKLLSGLSAPTVHVRSGTDGKRKTYLRNPNPRGIIVFTVDGSDPREQWTDQPRGAAFRVPLFLNGKTEIRSRILSRGRWSPPTIYITD